MSKSVKKFICMFIPLCIVTMLILPACGNSGETAKESNSAVTSQSQSATSSGAKDPKDIVEISILAPLFSDPPDMNNEYWTEYQRLTRSKLNIEWVDSGNFHTVFNLRVASGDVPEVSGVPDIRSLSLINAIDNGVFWDLTDTLGDFSKYPNLKNNVAPNCYAYLSLGGKIFALPRSRTSIDLGVNIRKDWLDKLGIPLPKTTAEYADALEKIVKSDADGNGQIDTVGLVATGELPGSLQVAFGALTPQYAADGGQYPPRLSDGWIDYVDFCRDLYSRGIFDKEYMSLKFQDGMNQFSSNRAASYVMSIWNIWEEEQGSAKIQKDPVPEVVSLMLTGPKGDSGIQLNTGVSGGYYISKKVTQEKLNRILEYMDDATSTELTKLAYYGIEGVHHTVTDGTPVLNKLGIAQINTSGKCVGPLAYSKYGKVDSAGGSKAYNEARRLSVEGYEAVGKKDIWGNGTLFSPTWSKIWPKHEATFVSNQAKTVAGQMSIDEFRAYVNSLRNDPALIPAFKEFTTAYDDFNKGLKK
ncbi:MAG TPA: extracellular solute-binding protein [Ruminiclostridium sp.]